jgi:beta-mannosidase
LREVSAPQAVFLSDEGTNGLDVHVLNERPQDLCATVELALYRGDGHCIEHAVKDVTIPAHDGLSLSAAQWFERWVDLNDAYGFGPPAHALVVATLRTGSGHLLAQAFHVLGGLPSERDPAVLPQGVFRVDADGSVEVTLHCDRFAAFVHVDAPGFVAEAGHFHIAPRVERSVRFVPVATPAPSFGGRVMALNGVYPGVLKPAA